MSKICLFKNSMCLSGLYKLIHIDLIHYANNQKTNGM